MPLRVMRSIGTAGNANQSHLAPKLLAAVLVRLLA